MLNLYLCPARGPRYQPSSDQLSRWLEEAQRGGLIHNSACKDLEIESDSPEVSLSPGLGVAHLFNRDAREELLPAELTFESLQLCRSTIPTLLPPDVEDQTQRCPQCEDDIGDDLLERELKRLAFMSFDQSVVFCQSCQAEIPISRLTFEPPASFARFWIELREVGSSRLNPTLLRAWELSLGSPLTLLIDHRVSDHDEIISARSSSELWEGLDEGDADAYLYLPTEVDGRSAYRASRYQRRRAPRDAKSGRRRRNRSRDS